MITVGEDRGASALGEFGEASPHVLRVKHFGASVLAAVIGLARLLAGMRVQVAGLGVEGGTRRGPY